MMESGKIIQSNEAFMILVDPQERTVSRTDLKTMEVVKETLPAEGQCTNVSLTDEGRAVIEIAVKQRSMFGFQQAKVVKSTLTFFRGGN